MERVRDREREGSEDPANYKMGEKRIPQNQWWASQNAIIIWRQEKWVKIQLYMKVSIYERLISMREGTRMRSFTMHRETDEGGLGRIGYAC